MSVAGEAGYFVIQLMSLLRTNNICFFFAPSNTFLSLLMLNSNQKTQKPDPLLPQVPVAWVLLVPDRREVQAKCQFTHSLQKKEKEISDEG